MYNKMDKQSGNKVPFKQIFLQIVGWVLFLSLPLAFRSAEVPFSRLLAQVFTVPYMVFCITYLALFFIIERYLIPRFYFRQKHGLFALAILMMLVFVAILKPYDRFVHFRSVQDPDRELFKQGPPPPLSWKMPAGLPPFSRPTGNFGPSRHLDIISIYLFLTVVAGALSFSLTQRWRETEQRVFKAETDKAHAEAGRATAELSFLKAQINPHFLFNTLNNIYSLAVIKSDKTADTVVKLSNIMRYLTEDASKDFIRLEHELKSISNYIDLQRLRLGKVEVSFTIIGDPQGKSVPPLILMTFVENAFKYGVSKSDPYPITIRVAVSESSISFYSENKVSDNLKNIEQSSTRVGVNNTCKRLEYLYPGKHQLEILQHDQLYKVNLMLNIS